MSDGGASEATTPPPTAGLVDWLRLVRIPLVVTAISNSVTAYLIAFESPKPGPTFPVTGPAGTTVSLTADAIVLDAGRQSASLPWVGLTLALVSSCLYLAGMALNDFFDRRRDAGLYPGRPIPSGKIPPATAFLAAATLLLVGVGASISIGAIPTVLAVFTVGAIFAYDGVLKRWAVPGSIAMGACRLGNGLLGVAAAYAVARGYMAESFGVESIELSLASVPPAFLERVRANEIPEALATVRPVLAPLAAFVFVTLLTAVSTLEDRPAPGGVLIALGAAMALVCLGAAGASAHPLAAFVALGPLAVLCIVFALRGARMGTDRGGAGKMVKWMLRSLLLLDAGLLFGAGLWAWALLPVGLYVPFLLLARIVGPPRPPPPARS